MELEPDICYRAVRSRDRRFDGKFFIGVTSTGIYCRPICPAPHALRANMQFYQSAAACEEAGFRPCLRCFPELSPNYVANREGSTLVARALNLISNGFLDTNGVADLAIHLGISERHLRRLFAEQIGASPISVALTRRMQLAKQLITGTKLAMTKIAFASGFPSIRQFNDSFRKLYGRTPSVLRRSAAKNNHAKPSRFELKLLYRPPFDWNASLAFLRPRLLSGIEDISGSTYRRFVVFKEGHGVVEIVNCLEQSQLRITVPSELFLHARQLVERARCMFDLAADPMMILDHLRHDSMLAVNTSTNLRLVGGWDPFADSVRIILGQQVSVAGASTVCARLIDKYGKQHLDGDLCKEFPSPTTLASADLSSIGIPKKRAAAIQAFSRAVNAGTIVLDGSMNPQEFLHHATGLPGIGDWTAQCIAMRALKEPDACPASDLGLKKFFTKNGRPCINERTILAHAKQWRPWRSYAVMVCWANLASETAK